MSSSTLIGVMVRQVRLSTVRAANGPKFSGTGRGPRPLTRRFEIQWPQKGA
jgi:hypothetical protein